MLQKKQAEKKPVLRMQLQEQSNMNLGIANRAQAGQDFVEVVNSQDTIFAEKGRLED